MFFVLSLALAAPDLVVDGACPGPATFEVTQATPNTTLAILTADGAGAEVMNGGPCANTALGLDATWSVRKTVTSDANGAFTVSPTFGAAVCGTHMQILDTSTCTVSNVAVAGDTGPADCTFVPDPALAVGESGQLEGTTAAHNVWRERVGVPRLVWNSQLAASAQAYADTCPMAHDPYRSPDAGFNTVGENIYWASFTSDGAAATEAWADERYDYAYGTAIDWTNFITFGHYTQVVWDTSTDLGCGYADCTAVTGWHTYICRYGEAGNWLYEQPYGYTADACVDLDNDDVLQGDDADDTDASVQ